MHGTDARAVLFDLDGTLTDPRIGITRSIQHALASLGQVPPAEDELLWCIGPPLKASFARLLDTEDPALLGTAVARYRERFSTIGLFENDLYAGVPEMLSRLRERGFRMFAATSKPRVFAERILDHFNLSALLDGVYGSELDGTRVDKGELIAFLLATEGLEPGRVVMVGDREHDMVGGAKCGVRCIGATYGYGSEEELLNHGAAVLAGSPAQVVAQVERLFGDMPAGGQAPPETFAIPGAAGIIRRLSEGEEWLLVQERAKAGAPGETGLLEIPAGKIRAFENIYDCLRREIREETGCEVTWIEGESDAVTVDLGGYRVLSYRPYASAQNLRGSYPIMVQTFLCEVEALRDTGSDESRDIHWMRLAELRSLLETAPGRFYPMHLTTLRAYAAERPDRP